MSRRCEREGVPWPRLRGLVEPRHLRDYGSLDVFWEVWQWRGCTGSVASKGPHKLAMDHLRERPVLPPWWAQEMLDDAREFAREWRATLHELTQEGQM